MGSVQEREQAPEARAEHIVESGFFNVCSDPAAQSESHALVDQSAQSAIDQDAVFPAAVDHAVVDGPSLAQRIADPMLQAFGEVRSLNRDLQRANDALHTVNETLRSKVDLLRMTALELEQMLDALELGVVLLDDELVVRHFNDMAAHFLALQDYDLGGSINAACRSSGPRLAEWCREVLRSGKHVRRSFHSAIGEPLALNVRRARVDGEPRLILVFAEEP